MSMIMTRGPCVVLCCTVLLLSLSAQSNSTYTSPYLSPTTIQNYHKMIQNFKVFIYKPNRPEFNFSNPPESLFYSSLRSSSFLTQNAEEAHLFFVPFSPDLTPRSLGRFIGSLRQDLPYWNRALGADHFYVSCAGIEVGSDRNLVELKKNSVQISCFPSREGKFIPHKDVTLPPFPVSNPQAPSNGTTARRFLGYVRRGSALVNELINEPDFVIESEPSDSLAHVEKLGSSKFCLLDYGNARDVSWVGETLRFGCVPVLITEGAVNDLPFMDVLRWEEIALFVRRGRGVGVKGNELKRVLDDTWRDRHVRMRGLGVAASKHFLWNESPRPFDAFNTVMYQMWLRRHSIRYTTRE